METLCNSNLLSLLETFAGILIATTNLTGWLYFKVIEF
jgi:hypothetical protein